MSDTQAAMREFRFLDEKRKSGGLSQQEEQRWLDLGGQLGMSAQQGYYAEDGAWYTYPPGYDPNTGQYYGGYQQPQHPGYAPAQQPYYDPNAPYYPPQPGYDPNAPYYPPQQGYDPNAPYDPNQQQYDPNQQVPYNPNPQQWNQQPPQQQWPANYDPATGQYYDPAYQQPQQPGYQGYVPPAPSAPPPEAFEPPEAIVAPAPLQPVPQGALAEAGPIAVAEDEVMEVTDEDVTLLDPSPPSAPLKPAAAPEGFTVEKPLTHSSVFATPAPDEDNLLGDLRSSLSFDEAPLTSKPPEPIAPAKVDPAPAPAAAPEPLVEASVEPEPEPSIDVSLAPEPSMPTRPPRIAEPIVAALAPSPMLDLTEAAPVAAALPPRLETIPEPVLAATPVPAVALLELMLAATPEPALKVAEPSPQPVDVAFEPEIETELEPRASERISGEAEMPSIMISDDLGAVVFEPTPRRVEVEAPLTLPSMSALGAMLGTSGPPPPPPPPSPPSPEVEPRPPLALTSVAPISATENDLYPAGIPAPPAAAAAEKDLPIFEPPPQAPQTPAAAAATSGDAIPAPRPSIPLSIDVEEPVYEGATETQPLLEASVEPELAAAPTLSAAPAPTFAASFDDLPVEHEPEPPPSTHTGFEASLGDLPPAIANEPPPAILDDGPMNFDVAMDDKPVPVEVPMDLGGNAGDQVELAKNSDFLQFPTSAADAGSFSAEGESLVESGTLATMANPSAPDAPMPLEPATAQVFDEGAAGGDPGDKLELASNAEFIGHVELNQTGESWTKQSSGLSLEPEPELDGEIIQGIELEEEPQEVVSAPEPEVEIQAEWAESPPAPAPAPAPAPPPLPAPQSAAATSAPWPSPLAIPAPAPVAWPVAAPARPGPAPVPKAPALPPKPAFVPAPAPAPKPATFVPGPPVAHTSSAPDEGEAPGRDLSLFATAGTMLRDEGSAQTIKGEHRVILHTVEGQVKRGALRDTNLGHDLIGLESQPGALEKIPRARIKAIFFMLPAGQKAPAPTGDKLRVTFRDGRQLAGFSSDHRGSGIGFFVVPADNRTNTERIFIYRASVEKVSVD